MGPEGRNMNMLITYWAVTGENEYGASSFGAPVLLLGRWEESSQQFRTPQGDDSVSKAVVWVPQDVTIDGYLALDNQTAFSSPDLVNGAEQIRQFTKVPDLRNASSERRAYL